MASSFEIHGIDHLSASSVNLFIAQPALWCASYLMGKRPPVGPAAHRGTAIEAGVEAGLFDPELPLGECQRIAGEKFHTLTRLSADARIEKERDTIAPSVEVALAELRQYGVPADKNIGGLRGFTSTAAIVIEAMNELFDQWEADKNDHRGQLPVVKCAGVSPVKTAKSTNYRPAMEIVAWTDRPAELPDIGAASPEKKAPPAAQTAAKPAHAPPPAAKAPEPAAAAPAGDDEPLF